MFNTLKSIIHFCNRFFREKGIKHATTRLVAIVKSNGLKGIINQLIVSSRDVDLPNLINAKLPPYLLELKNSYSPSIFFADYEDRKNMVPTFATKLVCFYLPQFHPIHENDLFWGVGFTEWTNVTKSFPLFKGHYQPRLPRDLGFYDLRLESNLIKQAEIARNYGIHGFCIHYYWFSGKKVMDTPLNLLFKNKSIDINFCLCWANENWTRRWDGNEKDVLLKQNDTFEDYSNFIKDIGHYFSDERYIKIDGKPVLVVYRAELLKNAKEAAEIWREHAKLLGFEGIYLILSESFIAQDPNSVGFDSAVDFAPNTFPMEEMSSSKKFYHPSFKGRVFNYLDAIKVSLEKKRNYPFYKSLCLEWDNTARKQEMATIVDGCNPKVFGYWLDSLIKEKPLNNLIFLNAWNEWAEGTYLEPDRKNGFAYLQKCYEILNRSSSFNPIENETSSTGSSNKHAIYLHIHYFDIFLKLKDKLSCFKNQFNFLFSVTDNINRKQIDFIKTSFPHCMVKQYENKGRDILPFCNMLRDGCFDSFDTVCKIHTKRSPHRTDGEQWGLDLVNNLLKFPAPLTITNEKYIWALEESVQPIIHHVGSNSEILNMYSNNWHNSNFVAGTMFWFSPKIKTILTKKIDVSLFQEEPIKYDGTYAHAVERLMGAWLQEAGIKIEKIKIGQNIPILSGKEKY